MLSARHVGGLKHTLTKSTCNSRRWHHIILGPAVGDQDQDMGGIWTHPQGLLEQFFHNIADAFTYLKGRIRRRLMMTCGFVLRARAACLFGCCRLRIAALWAPWEQSFCPWSHWDGIQCEDRRCNEPLRSERGLMEKRHIIINREQQLSCSHIFTIILVDGWFALLCYSSGAQISLVMLTVAAIPPYHCQLNSYYYSKLFPCRWL